MKKCSIFDFLEVSHYSATPIYLQLTNSILRGIDAGRIKTNDPLPSINELSFELDISRRTAEKGYSHLKKIGILDSFPGKGFFVKRLEPGRPLKICLLFNKLSAHKKIIYDSFVQSITGNVSIDLNIYNNDLHSFEKILRDKKDEYSHFVIIPHFLEGEDQACRVINSLPQEKLLLLDKKIEGIKGPYASAFENFEKDIYGALEEAWCRLSKYTTLKIIFPEDSYYPHEILKGMARFCRAFGFDYKVVNNIREEEIRNGDVFINVMEDDLVTLIERIMELRLSIGDEVGIISYNETPIKKILLNGITTISTDFAEMGAIAARLLTEHSTEQVPVPFRLKLRDSL